MTSIYTRLAEAFAAKVYEPNSDTYNASMKSYFTLQEAELRPACIVTPTSTQDVSEILKFLGTMDPEAKLATKVAVRGGGHAPMAGTANTDGGITIDLRGINTIELNESTTVVSVGGGVSWGQIYEKLDPMGLSVVGGHVYSVGVGGFTLGGGFSSVSPRYGLGCDMVENMEVVLADGKIVNANANENSDLFTALKGGSNNFGIVTRFDLKTTKQGKQWAGLVAYPISTLDENLKALAGMGNDWDPYANLKLTITYTLQTKFVIASILEYTKEDDAPAVFKPFIDIKPQLMNTMKILTVCETSRFVQKMQAGGVRQTFASTSFHFSLAHTENVYGLFKDAVAGMEDIKGMRWSLTYWRIHNSIASKSMENGGNSTSLDTSQDSLVLCILSYVWDDPSDDARMDVAGKKFIEGVDELSKKAGLFNGYTYANYCAAYQDPTTGYGDTIKRNLQAVSKKYDPEGFFQKVVTGGVKIPF